jgi:hypothetical protein
MLATRMLRRGIGCNVKIEGPGVWGHDTYDGIPTRPNDWIGATWATPQVFGSVVFQEGKHFDGGGCFVTIQIQVRENGTWVDVPNVAWSPAYQGCDGVNFETYTATFPDVAGDGIRVWGTMGTDMNGNLTTFLSCAELEVYPGTGSTPPAARWFGNRTAGSQRTPINPDNKRLSPFPLAESGSVTNLVMLLAGTDGGWQRTRPVIYRDDGGTPGSLVAIGPETVVAASPDGEWIPLAFTTPVALTPGTYWLGTISGTTSGAMYHYIGTTPNSRAYAWDPYVDGASDPAGTATPSSGPISIYAEYVP